MKALSETIIIVVTAVVILVAALVILTIFGGGIGQITPMTTFRTNCITQCSMTCKMGALPPTWTMEVNVEGGKKSCAGETKVPGPQCSGVCGESPSTGGGGTNTPTTASCQTQGKKLCCQNAECWCATINTVCPS